MRMFKRLWPTLKHRRKSDAWLGQKIWGYSHYEAVHVHAPVAFVTLSQSGLVLDLNDKAKELLSVNKSNVFQRKFTELLTPACSTKWESFIAGVFRRAHRERGRNCPPLICRLTSGRLLVVSASWPLRYPPWHRYAEFALIDITEQAKAKHDLLEQNAMLEALVSQRTAEISEQLNQLESIMNTANDAIFGFTEEGAIEFCNPASCQVFGFSHQRLLGMKLPDLFAADSVSLPELSRMISKQKPGQAQDLYGVDQNGQHFPISLSVNQIDHESRYIAIVRDMTERVALEKQLTQWAEEERNRIGRDIHDSVGQMVLGIGLQLKRIQGRFSKRDESSAEDFQPIIDQLAQVAIELRNIINDLCITDFEPQGLRTNLIWWVDNFLQKNGSNPVVITPNWPELNLPASQAIQVFRILQEAICNASKHSNARRIEVSAQQDTNNRLIFSVRDDGRGFDLGQIGEVSLSRWKGRGVNNMKHRAHIIGARFDITTKPGYGCKVACTLPLKGKEL